MTSASRIDRRSLLRAAGGTIALGAGAVAFQESRAATQGRWDQEADLVVVGSGAAALSCAVVAAAGGAKVIVVEAAPLPGGTTARSGGGLWIPNNRHMRARGLADPRADALRYMARAGYPALYDPTSATLGLPQNNFELISAFYDNAAPAIEALEGLGAIQTRGDGLYDCFDHAPENKSPRGRMVWIKFTGDDRWNDGTHHAATAVTPDWYSLDSASAPPPPGRIGGGAELVRQMKTYLDGKGVVFLTEHRATRLVTNAAGEVIGVEALADDGARTVSVRAHKAVHFGSGGFTLNDDLRRSFQRGPVFGACAPVTNQGDLIYMATAIGAKLGNMQNAWHFQMVLDQALQTPSLATDLQHLPGDAVFMVNKHGRRVVNEKRPYGDRGEVHYTFDPNHNEWTNLVLFMVFDQRVLDLCDGRYPYPPKGGTASYILKGDTPEALVKAISDRLTQFAPQIGGFQLDPGFAANLKETIARFNRFAETGVDEDFGRGSFRYDQQWNEVTGGRRVTAANDKPNKTMYPLSTSGPYYAVLAVKGQNDTNGGPVINGKAQILSAKDQPIPGLYGAGNCIAAPTGRGDLGGGGTLGPATTFGYIAGVNVLKEPAKAEA